MTRSCRID